VADTTINISLQTKGQQKLEKLNERIRKLEQQVQSLNTKLPQASSKMRDTGRAAATATANVQRFGIAFRSVLGPVVGVFGAINFLNNSLKVAGDRAADLAVLESGLEKVGAQSGKVQELLKAADELGKVTLFNEDDFTKGFALLTSFRKISVSSYERVARAAADVAQVTGQDVKSSFMQLAKALEDPARGLTALSRSGTTFTEGQKALVKQLVDTNRVAEAQEFILNELEAQYRGASAAAGSAGFAGQVDGLGEAFADLSQVIGDTFAPAVGKVIEDVTALINTFVSGMVGMQNAYKQFIASLRGETAPELQQTIDRMNDIIEFNQGQLLKVDEGSGGVALAKDLRNRIAEARKLRDETQADLDKLLGLSAPTIAPPVLSAPQVTGTKSKGSKTGKTKTDTTPERIRGSEQLVELRQMQLKLEQEQNQIKKIGLELDLEKLQINQEYENRLAKETSEIARQNLEKAKGLELEKATAEAKNKAAQFGDKISTGLAKASMEQKENNEQLTDSEKLWGDIYSTVSTELSQGIQGLIQGTTSLNDIASQLLSKLGGMFLDAAFGGLGKSLKIPGFADGGYPTPGMPSIVGEKGPEVFVPGQQGLVVPNDIFDATRAALGATGDKADQAFSENAQALAVADSYTKERMIERDRQTMLTGAGGSTTVQTQIINSVEYATIDQVQQVANLSAKKARAQVFADMRNRPSTRASLGLG
jgi:CII-binding regulator of phage lambda lysogenization HflD